MSEGSGSTAWSYDSMGRVLTRQQTIGTITKSIGFTYNLDGSTATMTYPSGRTYTYGYNSAAQPTSVVDVANSINFFTNGAYAPPGLLSGGIHGHTAGGWDAITLANTFNNRLQPTELKATSPVPSTLLDLTFSYSQPGNNGSVTQIANLRDSTRSVNYTYDQLNRLSKAETVPPASTWGNSYTYDNWGNLLQKTLTEGAGENLPPLAINNQNHVTTPAFSYDAAGNVLSDTSVSMTYDAEGRMITAAGTGFSDTYTYDGDGRRVKKSDGTLYWVDDNFQPLSIGTSSGLTKDFVFLGNRRIAFVSIASGNAYYYLPDHLGSTAVIASGDGKTIQWEADYFPFGNQRKVFTSSVNNSYQFTGDEYDSDTQYDYSVARFEAGRWSRFMSPDPYMGSMDVSNPQSLNRYSYVLNNPANNVDPLGLVTVPGPYCDFGDLSFAGAICEIFMLLPKDSLNGMPDLGSSHPAIKKKPQQSACLPAGVPGPTSAQCLAERPPIRCDTRLPNGQTVGDVVRQQRAALSNATVAGTNIDNLPTLNLLGTFGSIAAPGGPIDFKNTLKGQANSSFLASAGNFAYYATGSGKLSTFALDAGAGGYGVFTATFGSRHFSDLTGPMFSDKSAAAVRDAALASNGCTE